MIGIGRRTIARLTTVLIEDVATWEPDRLPLARTQHIPGARKWLAGCNDRYEKPNKEESYEHNEAIIYDTSKGFFNLEDVKVVE